MNEKVFARRLWISFGVIAVSIIAAIVAIYYLTDDLSAQAAAIVQARTAVQNANAAVANLAAPARSNASELGGKEDVSASCTSV